MFIALFARKYRKYYSKIVFLPKLLINRNSVASPDRTPRPPKLQLPFEQKKNDAGEWAYDHRIGLCVTLIAYLVLAIAFMVGKIVVGAKPSVQGIIIDTKTLAELEAEKMRLEQEDVDFANDLIHSELFRPPYARITPAQARFLGQRYKLVMWDIISRDYNRRLSPRTCLKNVTKHLAPGAIVVFHDSEKAFRNMRYALPRTLEKIRQMGLKCKAIEL
jgi:hypothetical protein